MADLFQKFNVDTSTSQESSGVDLFDKFKVQAPTVSERNNNAVNQGIDISSPANDDNAPLSFTAGKEVNDNIDLLKTIGKTRFTEDQLKGFQNNPIGFWESSRFIGVAELAPFGDFKKLYDINKVRALSEKKSRGEELTQGEQDTINSYLDTEVEKGLRGFSVGGGIGYGLSQVPAFLTEFAATTPVGAFTKKAATKAAAKVTEKAILQKTLATTASISARTLAMPQMYTAGYAERRLNDFTAITDKGELILKESEESPAKSAMMAIGYTSAEVASELSGAAIGKYVVSPLTKTLKTPLVSAVNKLPTGLKTAMYEAYKQIQPNAAVSKVFTNAGWNGLLEEMGEERVADVLKGFIGLAGEEDFGPKEFLSAVVPDSDKLLIEAGVISMTGGAKTSADIALNLIKSKGVPGDQAKEIVDNLSSIELDNFVEENLVGPESAYITDEPPVDRTDEILNYLRTGQAPKGETQTKVKKYPLLTYLKKSGGVNLNSPLADELRNYGVTPQTSVGLFRSEGGLMDIDNIAPEELTAAFDGEVVLPTKDDGSYVDRQFILDAVQSEVSGKPLGYYDPTIDITAESNSLSDRLSELGLDLNLMSNKEIREILSETEILEDEELAFGTPQNAMAKLGNTPTAQLASSQLNAVQKSAPPKIIDSESVFNSSYRKMVNEFQPIEDVSKLAKERGANISDAEDLKLLIGQYGGVLGSIRNMLQVNTFTKDENGNSVITGKALKSIMDDFDNYFITKEPSRTKREEDFESYLIAQRYLEDLKDREDVKVSDAQIKQSLDTITKLTDKYGNDVLMIETLAQEIYEYQKRILNLLVDSGIMSNKQFNDITSKNPHYIPFDRVIEENNIEASVGGGIFTDASSKKIIKKIKGSEKEVKNVFQSIIKNTAKIVDFAARNTVARNIAALAPAVPEYIQKVPTPIIKKGTAKIKVTYDKVLSDKLESAIALFSNKLERNKTVKVKGYKNVLGSYSPNEKVVRLKLGTNEGVMAHEVGHMLDYSLKLKSKLLSNAAVKKELQKLAEERLGFDISIHKIDGSAEFVETLNKTTNDKYLKYIKNDREIIANFFEVYVTARATLQKKAPTALKEFEKLIDADPLMAFIKDITPSTSKQEREVEQDVFGKSPYAPAGTMTVYNEGKEEYYRLARPILEAVKGMSPVQLNFVQRILGASASLLRSGATLVPEFWVRNVLRDQQVALLQSGTKYNPKLFVKGLFAVMKKNDLYNSWERSGGSFNSYMEMSDKGLQKAYQDLLRPGGKIGKYLKNPIKLLEDISMTFEQATRVGVFAGAKEQGASDIKASYLSREATLNFARRGSVGKQINSVVPFFNAGVQGVDKMIRTFKDNPKMAAFVGISTITFPSMMLTGYYLYGAPEDERREFLEIPEWKRDLFWLAKVNGEWVSYPKPFSYGYIFGSLPEKVMIASYKGDKPEGEELWKELALGLGGSFSPVYDASAVIPPLMKVAIEAATNYNFFLGRNIYPPYMENLEPEERYNKYTTETAKVIGKQFGISPAIVDNSIRGVIAGSATYVTGASDKVINQVKEWNGENIPEKPLSLSDIAVVKAFISREPVGSNSRSVNNFYQNWEKINQKRSTYNKLEGTEKKEYFEENRKAIQSYSGMKQYNDQIKGIRKLSDAVYDNETMSSEEKTKRIGQYDRKITDLSRKANSYFYKNNK